MPVLARIPISGNDVPLAQFQRVTAIGSPYADIDLQLLFRRVQKRASSTTTRAAHPPSSYRASLTTLTMNTTPFPLITEQGLVIAEQRHPNIRPPNSNPATDSIL